MCRPEDRAIEKSVAEKLAKHTKCTYVRAGLSSVFDFALVREGKPLAIVEAKRRQMVFGKYPTIHLSVKKIDGCLANANTTRTTFIFAVQCDDGLYACTITDQMLKELPRKQGGRFDRAHLNISTDIEELLEIPIESFKRIP